MIKSKILYLNPFVGIDAIWRQIFSCPACHDAIWRQPFFSYSTRVEIFLGAVQN